MKPKEKTFCRLMTVCADPVKAARQAGYQHPEAAAFELLEKEEVVGEIRRLCGNMRSIYENTAVCGLYRLALGGVTDVLALLYRDDMSEKELSALDLSNVSEIKKTDKGLEIKFCDRIKAVSALIEVLGTDMHKSEGKGLLDAILLSAEALGKRNGMDNDEL